MWPCVVTNFFLIKPPDALIFPNLFFSRKSTCFGRFLWPSSGVFHCTFGTGICHASLMTVFKLKFDDSFQAVIKPAWHIPVPNVQWKTPDDGQRNRPKHVEFLDKNTFVKISATVCFIKKKRVECFGNVCTYQTDKVCVYYCTSIQPFNGQ